MMPDSALLLPQVKRMLKAAKPFGDFTPPQPLHFARAAIINGVKNLSGLTAKPFCAVCKVKVKLHTPFAYSQRNGGRVKKNLSCCEEKDSALGWFAATGACMDAANSCTHLYKIIFFLLLSSSSSPLSNSLRVDWC